MKLTIHMSPVDIQATKPAAKDIYIVIDVIRADRQNISSSVARVTGTEQQTGLLILESINNQRITFY